MNSEIDSLREIYAQMETEELLRRFNAGTLTEQAQTIAIEELSKRGVTGITTLSSDSIDQPSREEAEKEVRAAIWYINLITYLLFGIAAVSLLLGITTNQYIAVIYGLVLVAAGAYLRIAKSVAIAVLIVVFSGMAVVVLIPVGIGGLVIGVLMFAVSIGLLKATLTWRRYTGTKVDSKNPAVN